ncbi:lytic murein transglycosylase [Polynucleobacter kasalickyi]|uniref:Membrane-bound lytic murein transglycosylase B n=1 Tax=Polynucleobacter kasalickyi TaxID=1938817 RepID=A0A1W1YBB1_9BURK|nr:lytic murein transglycosylase [Polynucleobacter kasalickyi]SMC33462.1 membrane-bound lytic murein transglycosylase B [Polynucleobacter kasalickyi]
MIFTKKFNIVLTTFCVVFSLTGSFSRVDAQPIAGSKTISSKEISDDTVILSQAQLLDLFLIEVGLRKNLSISTLREVFADVTPQLTAKKYIAPPPGVISKKNWLKYRQNAQDSSRVQAGQKFWRTYQVELSQIEKSTGIPAALIVGILGIETIYGKNMGRFPVRDVLVTLAFDYPDTPNRIARSQMFKEQLADLISFCSPSGQIDNPMVFKECLTQPSSFAGAIGMPQFMPTSLLKYATDGDKDGLIDLRNSPIDAMASIANFLLIHGWVVDQPILLPVNRNINALEAVQKIADGDPNPKWTLSQLKAMKIIETIPQGLNPTELALIVDLPEIDLKGNESTTYWVGLKNFEVITQYNRSFFYAMAVTEFGYTVANLIDDKITNPVSFDTLNSAKREKLRSINNGHRGHKPQKRL